VNPDLKVLLVLLVQLVLLVLLVLLVKMATMVPLVPMVLMVRRVNRVTVSLVPKVLQVQTVLTDLLAPVVHQGPKVHKVTLVVQVPTVPPDLRDRREALVLLSAWRLQPQTLPAKLVKLKHFALLVTLLLVVQSSASPVHMLVRTLFL